MLLGASRKFVAAADEAGAHVVTDFRPGGHEWTLWDALIQDVIGWQPVRTS